MSLQDETGRFTRRRGDSDFNSCGSSVTTVAGGIGGAPMHGSVFNERRVPPTHYEPSSGTKYMARSGFNTHDQYRRPTSSGLATKLNAQPPHRITFGRSPDYKRLYLSALIVVSLVLITLIVIILILFATKVFVVNTVMPLQSGGRYSQIGTGNGKTVPSTSTQTNSLDEWTPRGASSRMSEPPVETAARPFKLIADSGNSAVEIIQPPIKLPDFAPTVSLARWRGSSHEETAVVPTPMVTYSFECELYILLQRNAAYDDVNSFEYRQATANIQDALNILVDSPTLQGLRPVINLVHISNSANDLRAVFRLSGDVPATAADLTLDEVKVRETLTHELTRLEVALNGVEIDRTRLFVRLINEL